MNLKGSERNAPCRCGSGEKAKRCHSEGYPPEKPLVLAPPEPTKRMSRSALNAIATAIMLGGGGFR